ncbi:MAG: hypothetical protein ACJA1T_000011 [Zhongshania aliphaticivorans]|jgi:hypothetical protein|tara:strand:+ start:87549 stop:87686 length:138 start_codon:yes stop_codon:yes gene_type:complete
MEKLFFSKPYTIQHHKLRNRTNVAHLKALKKFQMKICPNAKAMPQ